MSSRSNGVMNEELTLRMISWVDSSAACSMSRICCGDGLALGLGRPEDLGQLLRARRRGGWRTSANRS